MSQNSNEVYATPEKWHRSLRCAEPPLENDHAGPVAMTEAEAEYLNIKPCGRCVSHYAQEL